MTTKEVMDNLRNQLDYDENFPRKIPVKEKIGSILARVPHSERMVIMHDCIVAWQAAASGIVAKTAQTRQNTGHIGHTMLVYVELTHSSQLSLQSKETSLSPLLLQGCGQALTVVEVKLDLWELQMPLQSSQRSSNWLGNQVQSTRATKNRNTPSKGWSKVSAERTLYPLLNSQSQFQCHTPASKQIYSHKMPNLQHAGVWQTSHSIFYCALVNTPNLDS